MEYENEKAKIVNSKPKSKSTLSTPSFQLFTLLVFFLIAMNLIQFFVLLAITGPKENPDFVTLLVPPPFHDAPLYLRASGRNLGFERDFSPERMGLDVIKLVEKKKLIRCALSTDQLAALTLQSLKNKEITLTHKQRESIVSILKQISPAREKLLKNQQRIMDIERELPALEEEFLLTLTPQEKEFIQRHREGSENPRQTKQKEQNREGRQ